MRKKVIRRDFISKAKFPGLTSFLPEITGDEFTDLFEVFDELLKGEISWQE